MIIDVHAHFVDRQYCDDLVADFGLTKQAGDKGQTLFRKGDRTYMWYRDDFFDPAAQIRAMDKNNVAMRLISVSTPNVYDWKGERQIMQARRTNDALAAYCNANPSRYRGLASLPLSDVAASLKELDRALDELGCVGVMIGSNVDGIAMNDPRFEPLWKRINERRVPVVEHPMFPAETAELQEYELPLRVGLMYDTTTAMARMIYSGIFERYSDFPYIAGHTGGALLMLLERLDNGYRLFPDCRKHIDKYPSEYAKRIYYDTCSFYEPALKMAHSIVGADHLLWGSDSPFLGADTRHIDKIDFSVGDKAKILGDNAQRIFKIQ
jgi:aminocarboxymuconate-semialdehyde decarboxylase